MNRRRPIKNAQERGVVRQFLAWLNQRDGTGWEVESWEDPPEAIIRDGNRRSWVEVTSAFPSDAYAHDAWSRATPGETHFDTSGRTHKNMTAGLAKHFVETVAKKRRKRSYLPTKETLGPGILVVDLHSPWFGEHTIEAMKQAWNAGPCEGDLGCFSEVYVVYPAPRGSDVAKWGDV